MKIKIYKVKSTFVSLHWQKLALDKRRFVAQKAHYTERKNLNKEHITKHTLDPHRQYHKSHMGICFVFSLFLILKVHFNALLSK